MNKYNPQIHHRRSIRLKGYDYAQAGLYFITICVKNRQCLFGGIKNGELILNDAGKIAENCWLEIPQHFPNVELHEFIIMPNHIHGIIEFVGAKNISPDSPTHVNISPDSPTHVDISPDSPTHVDISPDSPTHVDISPDSPTRVDISPDSPTHVNISPDSPTHVNISPDSPTHVNISPDSPTHVDISPVNNITDGVGVNKILFLQSPSKTIGSVVRGFKIGVTKWFRQNTNVFDVWQRNYYDHIICDEQSYQNISNYIINNPVKWTEDKFYI
jgi:putative transposase